MHWSLRFIVTERGFCPAPSAGLSRRLPRNATQPASPPEPLHCVPQLWLRQVVSD